MQRLIDIEPDVQFFADESNLAISSGVNLPIVNSFYKEFCGLRLFPELEITDDSIVTVAGQESYVWPINVQFRGEPALILQRTLGNPRNFVQVWPETNNVHWGYLKNVVQSFPSHYKKESQDGKNYSLLLRPIPNISGLSLLLIGQALPPTLSGPLDTTVFKEENRDRAFARFLAAKWQEKRGNSGRAQDLLDEVDALLPEGDYGPTAKPQTAIPWFT